MMYNETEQHKSGLLSPLLSCDNARQLLADYNQFICPEVICREFITGHFMFSNLTMDSTVQVLCVCICTHGVLFFTIHPI